MAGNLPNVLFIVSEDHGPHLGCWGDPNARTPVLDELAATGVRFSKHYTTCAVCSPGRASLLTGLYPHQNGQIFLATHRYAMYRPFQNMVSILKDAGYQAGRLGKLHVLPEEAFPFDFVWNDPDFISFKNRDIHAIAEKGGQFAKEVRRTQQPWLLYACFSDAHLPLLHQSFGVPASPRTGEDLMLPEFCPVDSPHQRDRLAAYYNCLERLDTGIGLLLDRLRQEDDRETVVVFTTDHGQQFMRGKVTSYEGGVRVPLIVHAPGRVAQGMSCEETTSHVDLLPTLLDLLDLPQSVARPGQSLLPLAEGRSAGWRQHLVTEWNGSPTSFFPQRTIRDDRFKLIVNYCSGESNRLAAGYLPENPIWETSLDAEDWKAAPEEWRMALRRSASPPPWELYDLENDPWELQNLASDRAYAAQLEELRTALVDWQKETDDRISDPEVREVLRQMHFDIAGKHYPNPNKVPVNREQIEWKYGEWIDPGIPE